MVKGHSQRMEGTERVRHSQRLGITVKNAGAPSKIGGTVRDGGVWSEIRGHRDRREAQAEMEAAQRPCLPNGNLTVEALRSYRHCLSPLPISCAEVSALFAMRFLQPSWHKSLPLLCS